MVIAIRAVATVAETAVEVAVEAVVEVAEEDVAGIATAVGTVVPVIDFETKRFG